MEGNNVKATGKETLKLKPVGIDTYRENVAYLHRDCHIYQVEGFQALARVEISNGDSRILCVLNVVDDDTIVTPEEVGLSETAFALLGLEAGACLQVDHAEPPKSMDYVRQKVMGERS